MIIQGVLLLALLGFLLYSLSILKSNLFLGWLLAATSLCSISLVLMPEFSNQLAGFFGVGRGADLLLYLCFVFGGGFLIAISVKFRMQSIVITEIARAFAIKEVRLAKKPPAPKV